MALALRLGATGDGALGENVRLFPGRPAAAAQPRQRILLSPPQLAGGELASLDHTLAAGWIAPAGPVPEAFEGAVRAASGTGHGLATSSGTAALHLGYRVLGVERGDEVWTSTLTFVATIAPAVQMGARPRFLDVDAGSWTLDPDLLESRLRQAATKGKLPRAVVPVDLYGQSCDLDTIVTLCGRWGVPVLCDSAEALGAEYRGRPVGKGAALAAFSFNGNKIVTAGGGGALVSDDAALIARARHLATQAKEAAPHYQHETTGYSYGLSSVLAAVGLAQIGALKERVAARRATFARYALRLSDLPGLGFMPEPGWGRSSRWLTTILIEPSRFGTTREQVHRALDAAGVESRPVWKPLHLQPAFRGAPFHGAGIAGQLFDRGLCLPSGAMTEQEQDRVIEAIRACHRG
ncbi:DegT/DnrJ/EryC1/StrS family aminotransferase [Roseomonas marmotae]|uniref:DegT/DnrJ/EryC1/StrS family aminotransferase n=1 Tax=Roseomonas marmotae TaxID=2768161 RepID=A0ABS3KHP1_9PROT|nr:DegT/DnrJ/EryC1/StrS family aminotransferase [Roseomonas marmotae]MBO1076994.1 DegT/DnrJ/EryC1/StrS family aminotransferase [Roseomonas marmotae]QTI79812.1 DegT/DnrJ/EryC1/StrS family aminotransferase [Roseomonas marmotae]